MAAGGRAAPPMSSLRRQVLRLAIPNALAAVSVPLTGIADTAMVGHLPEVASLGAVATACAIFDVLFWGTGFLRMGTTSLVAQYCGAGDQRACAQTLYRALGTGLAIAALVLLGQRAIAWAGFGLAGGSPPVQAWGQRYFAVRVWGVPLVLVTLALNGFFLGMANAVAPMAITVGAGLVNVAADYALIYGHWGAPALGVLGAAWAAVLANLVAALSGVVVLVLRYRPVLRVPLAGLLDRRGLRHLCHTHASLLGRTLCLLFAQFTTLSLVSRLGEVPLAAHAVLWQVWALVSYGVDGFAHAAETLVGNRLGAQEYGDARRVARRVLQLAAGIGLAFLVVFAAGLEPIGRLFTDHAEVVAAIRPLGWAIALVQPLNAVVFVLDGVFIGANDVGYLFRAMAIAAFGAFAPVAWGLVVWLGWGLLGAWLAYDALMVGRFVTLYARYRGDRWLRTFVAPAASGRTSIERGSDHGE
jgi:MATE family multidrug resistance protein